MAEMYAVSGETLTGIANAIRGKTGSDDLLTVSAMASAIDGLNAGGQSDATLASFISGDQIDTIVCDDTVIRKYAFAGSNVRRLLLPNGPKLSLYSIIYCNVEYLSPVLVPGVGEVISHCDNLKKITFLPESDLGRYACPYNISLKTVEFLGPPNGGNIYQFRGCTNLQTVICRSTDEPKRIVTDSLMFSETPIEKLDGKILVPREKIDFYKGKMIWAETIIHALEDYTDDGTTTGNISEE